MAYAGAKIRETRQFLLADFWLSFPMEILTTVGLHIQKSLCFIVFGLWLGSFKDSGCWMLDAGYWILDAG